MPDRSVVRRAAAERTGRRARQRGQATPLLAVVVLVAGLAALPLTELGRAAIERSRARTAADAAALAGAAGGAADARALATANGGLLTGWDEDGRFVVVTVRVGDRQARARAERRGSATGGGAQRTGLAPAMVAAIARAEAMLGRPVPIVSGYRSPAHQQALWDRRHTNPYPVARPGTSRHEQGLAIDVPRSFVPVLLTVVPASGLCQPLPRTDPIHFELCRWRPP